MSNRCVSALGRQAHRSTRAKANSELHSCYLLKSEFNYKRKQRFHQPTDRLMIRLKCSPAKRSLLSSSEEPSSELLASKSLRSLRFLDFESLHECSPTRLRVKQSHERQSEEGPLCGSKVLPSLRSPAGPFVVVSTCFLSFPEGRLRKPRKCDGFGRLKSLIGKCSRTAKMSFEHFPICRHSKFNSTGLFLENAAYQAAPVWRIR